MSASNLAVRINRTNPNHHLWDNHGTWWVHYTLHLPDFTKRRMRQSLATRRVETARQRRDALLDQLPSASGYVTDKTPSGDDGVSGFAPWGTPGAETSWRVHFAYCKTIHHGLTTSGRLDFSDLGSRSSRNGYCGCR